MSNPLRYDIAESRLAYDGRREPLEMSKAKVSTFNSRHLEVLSFYGLELAHGTVFTIDDRVNGLSNLGVFRSKNLRQGVILAAALPAAAPPLRAGPEQPRRRRARRAAPGGGSPGRRGPEHRPEHRAKEGVDHETEGRAPSLAAW